MKKISDYYSNKIKTFGATPNGVDWNSKDSQEVRFAQLCNLIKGKGTLLDYGCGYGHLREYLNQGQLDIDYTGFDFSKEMLGYAYEYVRELKLDGSFIDDLTERVFDYVLASGVFSVKLDTSEKNWTEYIKQELTLMDQISERGFAVNMLTTYSDKKLLKDHLFYADPSYWFDYCKQKFSRNVALLHDYDIYEFTLIVRK